MPVSSPTDDVRAQYEALPYPARDPRDEAIRLIIGTPSHILEVNHYLFSGRLNFARPFRALVMYDRQISLGRHADRPVAEGGPTEPLAPPVFGEPIYKRRQRIKAAQAARERG